MYTGKGCARRARVLLLLRNVYLYIYNIIMSFSSSLLFDKFFILLLFTRDFDENKKLMSSL